ncbi:MAG: cytochrome b/b6 domain-containing protein [Gammaproteobacteria bacterium]
MDIRNGVTTSFWDNKTKFLHMGLALVVSLQLFNSLVMQVPKPGRVSSGFGGAMFEFHEWAGMTALVIVLAHWMWSIWGVRGSGIRHLFPFTIADRLKMRQELRDLQKFNLPPSGPAGRLPGLIHGLGLLAVTAIALTGAVLFFGMPEGGGKLPPFADFSKETHEVLSTFVWIYWGGHGALALLHGLVARDGSLYRMFKLS